MISAEHDGFHELEFDLGALPSDFPEKVGKVASRGALNIKKDWADRWRGHPTIKDIPRSISYDTTVRKTDVESEVGPAHGRSPQATLAHLIEFEYGSAANAPIPGGMPALAAEEPRFVAAIADLAEKEIGK